jgi:hypothetical protein
MPCKWIRQCMTHAPGECDGTGPACQVTTIHLNMSSPRRKKCAFCGDPNAGALCDYPLEGGGTCDKSCCYRHRRHVGRDRDYCADHWDQTKPMPEARKPAQEALF